jgi:hypothetical protein
MDIQWSAKRSSSTGSRRSLSGSGQQKELLVYHRRSFQERDAAVARRLANSEGGNCIYLAFEDEEGHPEAFSEG